MYLLPHMPRPFFSSLSLASPPTISEENVKTEDTISSLVFVFSFFIVIYTVIAESADSPLR